LVRTIPTPSPRPPTLQPTCARWAGTSSREVPAPARPEASSPGRPVADGDRPWDHATSDTAPAALLPTSLI
jgi:hypothetical protein